MAPSETRTTCCYCGVGCGVIVGADGGRIVSVRGDPDHPANRGKLCSKGTMLHLTATPEAQRFRAREPLMRRTRSSPLLPVTWDTVLDLMADRFAASIRAHGPDSVAFYVSGQLLTEDYYVFNKLAKGLIGTNNIDTNSRLCMASAASAYKLTLGADAPPCCYDDVDAAELLLIAGANPAWAHPVLFRRIEAMKAAHPERRIVVVDPRRTPTADLADLHLAIEPGTDVALFHGMLHAMIWEGWIDHDYVAGHTAGFDALRLLLRDYAPATAAAICGISVDALVTAARWFAQSPAALSLYCQGLNQSTAGTDKNAALINLHLATGQIGKPGAGPFSLTGQPNAMGGREVGGMATLLSAHRDLSNPAHRAEVAALWGVTSVPDRPGHTAVELFDALAGGDVKMVWIACTNPAQSLPDQARVRAGLERAELVVLQEAYVDTETAAFADIILPAASWGEKEGTVTNSERCISRVRRAVAAPGVARDDWAIAVDFARRLEDRLTDRAQKPGPTLFPYPTPEAVFDEHVRTTRGRDLDITGLSYALLESRGPQQWPYPEGASAGMQRLYGDGVFPTADGKACFAAPRYRPVAEATDARYPFRLNTGRLRDQWHGMSRTGTAAQLFRHTAEPALSMHPSDIARRGLAAGDLARVGTRRGSLVVAVQADDSLRPGQVFLPMHWGSLSLGGDGTMGVNGLTSAAFCPQSRQPELKHAAARIAPAGLPWRLVAFGIAADGNALSLRAALQPLLGVLPFAALTLTGGKSTAVLFRAAAPAAIDAAILERIDAAFALRGDGIASYDDATRGIGRRVHVAAGRLRAARLSGDLAAEGWLREWLAADRDVATLGAQLLLPSAVAPAGHIARGPIVCTCHDVSATELRAELARGEGDSRERLARAQERMKCGTSCGSCLPEIRRLAAAVPMAA